MSIYALVDGTNVVQRRVAWDGLDPGQFGSFTPVLVSDDLDVDEGDTLNPATLAVTKGVPFDVQNRRALTAKLSGALVRLRQIKTQAATFQAQPNYTAANVAAAVVALNDLLAKNKIMAAAISDLADDLIAVSRLIGNNLDATN